MFPMPPHLPLLLLTLLAPTLAAVDGFSINSRESGSIGQQDFHIILQDTRSHGLYRHDIKDGKVTGSRLLCPHPGVFPTISPDGTQVVFYRQGIVLDDKGMPKPGGDPAWRLSLMQVDGSGLKDLLPLEGKGLARIAWPLGDWVHYHRPSATHDVGTGQIWRVNVKDPTQHELVLDVNADPAKPAVLSRFSLDLAGGRVGLRVIRGGRFGGNDVYAAYPPKDDDDQRATPVGRSFDRGKGGRILRCMLQLSPSGDFLATFPKEDHSSILVHTWDHAANQVKTPVEFSLDDAAKWAGESDMEAGKYIRWSVNSDQWITLQAGKFGNAYLINWVDKTAIALPKANKRSDCPGTFWIEGPVGSLQGRDGKWTPVTPSGRWRP